MLASRPWPLFVFLLVLGIAMSSPSQSQPPPQKQFIVQLTPIIDSKHMSPFNLSLSINQSTPLQHTLTLNRNNFNRNVSVIVHMFAWYNGNWISKKQRKILITQKKFVEDEADRLTLKLMKFRRELSKSIFDKAGEGVLINNANIYISYDPQASLMVSQIENPEYFIPNSAYIKISSIPTEVTKVNVTLTFRAIPKTNNFIENRRHLSELAEIQERIKEPVTILAHPFTREMIEPSIIYENFKKNLASFISQQKKITDKITMLRQYNKYDLLTKGRIKKFQLGKYLPRIEDALWKNGLVYKDNVVPLYQWIFMREEMVSTIGEVRQAVLGQDINEITNRTGVQRQLQKLQTMDLIGQMSSSSSREAQVAFYIGLSWILLDIVSYLSIASNLSLSIGYGTFLNLWLLMQLLAFAVRMWLSLHVLAGVSVLLVGLILHWVVTWAFERKYLKYQHRGSFFDSSVTIITKNLLILVMVTNVCLHLFVGTGIGHLSFVESGFQALKKIDSSPLTLLCWCFQEFDELLAEYYYVLAILPQIMLNFKMMRVERFTILRIAMLGGIFYGKFYLFGVGKHWSEILLWGKQGLICAVLVLQLLFLRSHDKISLLYGDIVEEKQSQSVVEGERGQARTQESIHSLEDKQKVQNQPKKNK